VLALAFLLAAGGTALGLTLAGHPGGTPSASGTSSPPTSPAQVTPVNTQTTPVTQTTPATPATSYGTTASSPASHATSSTTPASTPVSTPVSATAQLPVLTVGSYSGTKPTEIAYSGDSTNVVTNIAWTSWTATGASGQGTSDIDSCVPNCAQAPASLVPATITLTAPVNGTFTQMTETRNGTSTSYTYPNTWAQSAS
jgi:hypothetical protein